MLASELVSLLDQIRACERGAERLLADLDEDAINRTPLSGGWSIAQCLGHLTLMNAFYLRGWLQAAEHARRQESGPFRGLRPTMLGRWFVRSMEPPYRMRGKAAAATVPPPRVPRAGLLEAYKASHDEYRALVQVSAAIDVNRVVGPNAILRSVKMRLSTVLLIVPAHDRRHLWQAENVKRALTGA